jgi:hypothetical protein
MKFVKLPGSLRDSLLLSFPEAKVSPRQIWQSFSEYVWQITFYIVWLMIYCNHVNNLTLKIQFILQLVVFVNYMYMLWYNHDLCLDSCLLLSMIQEHTTYRPPHCTSLKSHLWRYKHENFIYLFMYIKNDMRIQLKNSYGPDIFCTPAYKTTPLLCS